MTSSPARVLAVVELDPAGRALAREAAILAGRSGARLALAHVVSGQDAAAEMESRLSVVVRRRLERMAAEIGRPDATPLVGWPGSDRGLAELLRTWQPDLAVLPSSLGLGADGSLTLRGWSCKALSLSPSPFRAWREAAS